MCLLADKSMYATGTVLSNRLGKAVPYLKTGKALPKGNCLYGRIKGWLLCYQTLPAFVYLHQQLEDKDKVKLNLCKLVRSKEI